MHRMMVLDDAVVLYKLMVFNCCISNTIFVTDAAAGKVKLVVSKSGTLSFLYHLGLIYDSFGITCKGSTPAQMTPELVVSNVRRMYVKYSNTFNRQCAKSRKVIN